MVDTRSPAQRSAIMRAVKGANTTPERAVRSMLHRRGYRFRLHAKELPGTPDIAFPSRGKVIFVHGCYWHGHNCPKGRLPKSRLDYWGPKIAANRERDRRKIAALKSLGWRALTVWQCELADTEILTRRITQFLGPPGKISPTSMAK